MKSSSHNNLHKKKKKVHHRSRNHHKNKSKKHLRKISLSPSDDDYLSSSSSDVDDTRSVSSFPPSSSSLEDGSRRRGKKRKSAQRDSKSRRKRARHSSSHGSDRHGKRKRAKLKVSTSSELKRKRSVNKKRRSTRSRSSDSYCSCSTRGSCSSRSSGDSDQERSRKRGKSKSSTRDKRRYRSQSCSPSCSGSSQRSYPSEEMFKEGGIPKRLGSIITIARRSDETKQPDQSKYENRAEIIQACDDCPSPRSNDSYEGGKKRESEMALPVNSGHIFENKTQIDKNANDENDRDQCSWKDPLSCNFKSTSALPIKKSEVSGDTGGPEVDEIELRLRIKALENFTKFRRGIYANAKSLAGQKDGHVVAKQLTTKAESVRNLEAEGTSADRKPSSSIEMHGCNSDGIRVHESNGELITGPLSHSHMSPAGLPSKPMQLASTISRDPSATNLSISTRISPAGNNAGKPSKPVQLASTIRHDPSISCHVDDEKSGQVAEHTFIGHAGSSGKENSDAVKQALALAESSNEMLLEPTLDKNVSVIPEAEPSSNQNLHGLKVNAQGSTLQIPSSHNPESGDLVLKEKKVEERKDSSQFEQKTMSVMRGGEMVQVSYKVYIPKKPPPLARRQLRR